MANALIEGRLLDLITSQPGVTFSDMPSLIAFRGNNRVIDRSLQRLRRSGKIMTDPKNKRRWIPCPATETTISSED